MHASPKGKIVGSNPTGVSNKELHMERIYIFDVDDTLIATTACVCAVNPDGKIVFKAGTKVFNAPDSTERLLQPGLTWDFSEFESLEQLMIEPTKSAFDFLRNLRSRSNVYIITARQKQAMLQQWLATKDININLNHIHCFDRNYGGTVAQWKGEVVDSIISEHPEHEVVIFEDDPNNCLAMAESCIKRNVMFQLMPV